MTLDGNPEYGPGAFDDAAAEFRQSQHGVDAVISRIGQSGVASGEIAHDINQLGSEERKDLTLRLAANFTDGREQSIAAEMFRQEAVRFTVNEINTQERLFAVGRLGFYAARHQDGALLDAVYERAFCRPEESMLDIVRETLSDETSGDNHPFLSKLQVQEVDGRGQNAYLDLARRYHELQLALDASDTPTEADETYGDIQEFNISATELLEQLYAGQKSGTSVIHDIAPTAGMYGDILKSVVDVSVKYSEKFPDDPRISEDLLGIFDYLFENKRHFLEDESLQIGSARASMLASAFEPARGAAVWRLCELNPSAAAEIYVAGRRDSLFYKYLAAQGQVKAVESIYETTLAEEYQASQRARDVALNVIWAKYVSGQKDSKIQSAINRAEKRGSITEQDAENLERAIHRDKLFREQ